MKKGQLQKEIGEVTVEFLDTNEILVLETRTDSVCHFFPKFCVNEKEEVQLRIDWTCVDRNNNSYPVLDADFYNKKTGKPIKGRRKSPAQREAHHTETIPGKGRCYRWIYKDDERDERTVRPFRVMVEVLSSFSVTAGARITIKSGVIRGD
jgi:hypothetical protein